MSVSPLHSPLMGTHQPPSKRDKKRAMLEHKLADMTAQFAIHRDAHYRQQLQNIQIDMNLVVAADTHGPHPLSTDPTDIQLLVQECIQTNQMKFPNDQAPPGSAKMYSEFAKAINDAMEERDAKLVMHLQEFENKKVTIENNHAFRKKLASNEHKALSSTTRDRLINSVAGKKSRLSKDKETIEIGDASAQLLHPSQFGVANPASPGGVQPHKRATRNRRDADDFNLTEGNKRKRKTDSDESPAPPAVRRRFGPLDRGSPDRPVSDQQIQTAPLYSIEKLFTEKEIQMTYTAAALAAQSYIQRHSPKDSSASTPNGTKSENTSDQDRAIATVESDAQDAPSPPAQGGTGMERTASHITRSTRGNFATGYGIDAFDDSLYPPNYQALMRAIPRIPYQPLKGKSAMDPNASTMLPASTEDVAAELEIIRKARQMNDEKGAGWNLGERGDRHARQVLEAASAPKKDMNSGRDGFGIWVASENRSRFPKVAVSSIREGGEAMIKEGSRRGEEK